MKTKLYLFILPFLLMGEVSRAQIVAEISVPGVGYCSNYGSIPLQSGNLLHFRYHLGSNTMYAIKTNPNFHEISTVSNQFDTGLYILPAKPLVKDNQVYMAMGLGGYLQTGSGIMMFDSNGVHVKSISLSNTRFIQNHLDLFDWDDEHIGISFVNYETAGFNIAKVQKNLNQGLQQPVRNYTVNGMLMNEVIYIKSVPAFPFVFTAILQFESAEMICLTLLLNDAINNEVQFSQKWSLPLSNFPFDFSHDYEKNDLFLSIYGGSSAMIGFKNYLFSYMQVPGPQDPGYGFKVLPDSLTITGLSIEPISNRIILNAKSHNTSTVNFRLVYLNHNEIEMYSNEKISNYSVSGTSLIGTDLFSGNRRVEKFSFDNVEDCHSYLTTYPYQEAEYLSDHIDISSSSFNSFRIELPPPQIQNAQSSVTYLCDVNHLAVDEEDEAPFQVFPNPVSDWVYIKSEEPVSKVQIIDLSGKLVEEFISPQNSIHIGNLGSGIYFLRGESNQKMFVQKLIIARN